MKYILAYTRLFCILFFIPPFIFWYLITTIFCGQDMKRALRIRRSYIKIINYIIGLRISVLGLPPKEPGLFICNHRSFLDPFVSVGLVDSLPVAKAEVSKYPLFGKGAEITGIIYVDRDQIKSRANTKIAISKWIKDNFIVLIYPEGTVNDGDTTKQFKHGSFKIAAENKFRVYPMAIEYKERSDRWGKNTPLKEIFIGSLGRWKTYVTAYFGPEMISDDYTILVSKTQGWIDKALLSLRKDYDN